MMYSWLIATLTTISTRIDSTTAAFSDLATPVSPRLVHSPFWHET